MLQLIPIDPMFNISARVATVVVNNSLCFFFLYATFATVVSLEALCTCNMATAKLMQDTIMGMTVGVIAATINLLGCGLRRGMLVGGSQVGTAAGATEQGTTRVDDDRRGPTVGGAGVATPRHAGGGWRSAEDEDASLWPEPD